MKNCSGKLALFVLSIATFCVATSSAALAQRKWGAVAYTSGAAAYNSQWNHASESEALAKAVTQCQAKNSGRCDVQTFSGENCLALISGTRGGTKYSAWTRNAGFRATQDKARQLCQTYTSCEVRTIVCANGNH